MTMRDIDDIKAKQSLTVLYESSHVYSRQIMGQAQEADRRARRYKLT